MPVMLRGEIEEVERMQSKALKKLLQDPKSTSNALLLREIGIWLAKKYLQYSTMMLYHHIVHSEEGYVRKNIVKE